MNVNDDLKDILDDKDFRRAANHPAQSIKVIGVGGGGNNAVIHMHKKGIKDVSFVLLNTDRQVLEASEVPTKVLIGPGRGAGGKPERARKYAEESAEQIAELFDDHTDMVFITAGMGGGTGTGAAPVVARIAKERGILTVGIVTVPFIFEGEKKVLKALEGADEMAKNVDSLLVINNQRLTEIYQNLNIFNAFAKADDTLLNAAQSITDIITYLGVVNCDFNDVDTTLREGGTAIISTGYGEGPGRVTAAIQDALNSPLLRNTDIFGSKKLLMVLYVSDDQDNHPFNMEETAALDEFISGIDNDVEVKWGLYTQPGLDDKVRITLLASGFEVTINRESFDAGKNNKETGHSKPVNPADKDRIKDEYGSSQKTPVAGRVLNPDSYDDPDDEALNEIETKTAIGRNPYKQFISGINGAAFRGSVHREAINRATGAQNEENNTNTNSNNGSKSQRNDDGNLLINFDDLT